MDRVLLVREAAVTEVPEPLRGIRGSIRKLYFIGRIIYGCRKVCNTGLGTDLDLPADLV